MPLDIYYQEAFSLMTIIVKELNKLTKKEALILDNCQLIHLHHAPLALGSYGLTILSFSEQIIFNDTDNEHYIPMTFKHNVINECDIMFLKIDESYQTAINQQCGNYNNNNLDIFYPLEQDMLYLPEEAYEHIKKQFTSLTKKFLYEHIKNSYKGLKLMCVSEEFYNIEESNFEYEDDLDSKSSTFMIEVSLESLICR